MMKKIIIPALLILGMHSVSYAAINEVVKEASGSGSTQHQAVSEALLVAVQSVNGASVAQRVDMNEIVNVSMSNQHFSTSNQTTPVYSVQNPTAGSVTKFQVLSVSGSKGSYRARVRAHVAQFESTKQDQYQRRIAVLPFQFKNQTIAKVGIPASDFSIDMAESLGNLLAQNTQLSLVDRHYIEEMALEKAFLNWDGAPVELARIGQKVGADLLVVGRINELSSAGQERMYGMQAGAAEVRIMWRVIEANTGKVITSGNFNRVLSQNKFQNILNNQLDDSRAEVIAQGLSHEVLAGLKLQPDIRQVVSEYTPTYDVTPGSSEQPVKW
jgi:TolB-like protein